MRCYRWCVVDVVIVVAINFAVVVVFFAVVVIIAAIFVVVAVVVVVAGVVRKKVAESEASISMKVLRDVSIIAPRCLLLPSFVVVQHQLREEPFFITLEKLS